MSLGIVRLIKSIVNQGTKGVTDVIMIKHIRFANAIALVLGLDIIQNAAIGVYYGVRPLAIIQSFHVVCIGLVPVFNHYGRRLFASVWFAAMAILFVSLYAIFYSLDTNVIFYLPLTIFLVFLFPASESRYVIALVSFSILCFIGALLWHFYQLPPPFYMPPGFMHMQRLSSLTGLPFLSIVFGLYAFSTINRAERDAAREKDKTEQLLLNILPEQVAERFKYDQSFLAEGFESVTVLFADIVEFTRLSDKLKPDVLVAFLNKLFSEFDQLIEQYGLEKIKTIGDAYMVAGGVPVASTGHALKMCEVAIGMQKIAHGLLTPTGEPLYIRIGINTGPVTAGVIGVKKFIYDLWGDTVNTASRMESHAEASTIQITEEVYRIVKDEFECHARGVIPVKGKGTMSTYFLVGRHQQQTKVVPVEQDSYY